MSPPSGSVILALWAVGVVIGVVPEGPIEVVVLDIIGTTYATIIVSRRLADLDGVCSIKDADDTLDLEVAVTVVLFIALGAL